MIRLYAYAAIAAAIIALGWYAHHSISATAYALGQADCQRAHAVAQERARVETSRRETASADASTAMLDYLAANLPPIETRTHDAIERIRTVYVDRPVPDSCRWDDSVRDELRAARQRANGAQG